MLAEWESMYFPSGNLESQDRREDQVEAADEHLEPVVPPETGFGDFPLATPDGAHLSDGTELLDGLVNISAATISADVQDPQEIVSEENLDETKVQLSDVADTAQAEVPIDEPSSQATDTADALPVMIETSTMSETINGTVLGSAELLPEETLENRDAAQVVKSNNTYEDEVTLVRILLYVVFSTY